MKLSDFIIGVGRPIAFYPGLRRVTGSTTATVFLCQLIYWTGKEERKDGWIYKQSDEIEKETGLSYYEQKTARLKLVKAGLLSEKYARLEHQINFKVNFDALNDKWGNPDNHIPECDNASLGNDAFTDSLYESEITTEITTKTTSSMPLIPIDNEFGKLATAWEKLHGVLTQPDALFLGEMLDDWRRHCKTLPAGHPDINRDAGQVILDACRITAENAENQRSMKYTRAILVGWMRNGYGSQPKFKKPTGGKNTSRPNSERNTESTPADLAIARKIVSKRRGIAG